MRAKRAEQRRCAEIIGPSRGLSPASSIVLRFLRNRVDMRANDRRYHPNNEIAGQIAAQRNHYGAWHETRK